jgi:hypothetical protein
VLRCLLWILAIGAFVSCGGKTLSDEPVEGSQGSGGGAKATGDGDIVAIGSGGSARGAGGSGGAVRDAGLGGAIVTGSGGRCNGMAGCVGSDVVTTFVTNFVCPAGDDCYPSGDCYGSWCSHRRMEWQPCSAEDNASDADRADAIDSSPDAAVCDPEVEHNRDYYYLSRPYCGGNVCNFCWSPCPPHTKAFLNDFGCGCEQASSCPSSVDCYWDGAPENLNSDPLCTINGRATCPYTVWGGL